MPIPIDDDVRAIAKEFGLDPALIQAVVKAEGNIVRAIQCTFPTVDTRDRALRITCRSAVHAMCDFIRTYDAMTATSGTIREQFVAFWAARWAPRGAENDPDDLNRNWPSNVRRFWLGV